MRKVRTDRREVTEGATVDASSGEGSVKRLLARLRSDGALAEDVEGGLSDCGGSSERSMPLSSYQRNTIRYS